MFASDIRNWLAVSSFLAVACSAETAQPSLDWRVRFACEADRAQSATLELRIQQGRCGEGGRELFAATLSPGEPVPIPEGLREGAYSFVAVAKGNVRVVASNCSELSLPSAAPLLSLLAGDGCDAAQEDGSTIGDSGTSDSDSDAHIAPVDGADAGSDAASGQEPTPDASLEPTPDATPAESGSATCDACGCAGVSCFTARLFLTYAAADAASWSPTHGLDVSEGAIARVSWMPGADAGKRLQERPAPQVVMTEAGFAGSAEIDAFALLPDGRYLFSTRGDESFHGEAFDDDDLIAFEPLSQTVSRHLDLGSLLTAVSGSDVDVDALHVAANGDIYFSVDAQVKANNALFSPADLLRLGSSGVERLVIGADAWGGRDLESLAVDPETGHFIASFAGSGRLGDAQGGASVGAADAVLLAFGPGHPYAAGYRLFLQAELDFDAARGSLSALHFE